MMRLFRARNKSGPWYKKLKKNIEDTAAPEQALGHSDRPPAQEPEPTLTFSPYILRYRRFLKFGGGASPGLKSFSELATS